ncbi:G protein-coupled glucose receptor regulating Gpa2-domain-containing protein [Geopyxis carbonaria]|nr:G protein-coupled glucose receptor regulating Gpa2-domain-containing protein [Geopyxis carbonaria]
MGAITGFNLAKSVLGLMGNASSAVGAGFIALCYIFLLPVGSHFRHKLILNLAIADFMNATIGTFNQCYLLYTGATFPAGPSCTGVGTLVQISVQAIDVSILAIAIVTVMAIVKPRAFEHWSATRSYLAVASIWILPLTTALSAAAAGLYEPATGGWCWIKPKPAYLRYVLTHGWRFVIIAIIFGLYIYLYIFLRSHFKELSSASGGGGSVSAGSRIGEFRRKMSASLSSKLRGGNGDDDDEGVALREMPPRTPNPGYNAGKDVHWQNSSISSPSKPLPPLPALAPSAIHVQTTINMSSPTPPPASTPRFYHPSPSISYPSPSTASTKFTNTTATTSSASTTLKPFDNSNAHAQKLARIRKVLLMRAYPTWFVVLWIPGIANRMVEATGGVSPPWLILLQSSTSYIGLANAITYGWNEGIMRELKRKIDRRRRSGDMRLDGGVFA